MDNATIAAVLLVIALIAMLASTRQMALLWRLFVWGGGMICLISAITLVIADDQHSGLFRAARDLAENIRQPEQSVLGQALVRNGPGVVKFVLPVLDLFLLIGAVLAVLALLAFTPGEATEKLVRTLTTGLLGAMVGGVVALTIVGMGFGDFRKQRVYAGVIGAENDVHDGDTFWLGEVSLRLLDADAPELNQICFDAAGQADEDCGEKAEAALESVLRGQLVSCQSTRDDRVDDSFGRPLTHCRVAQRHDATETPDAVAIENLSERMVRNGFAVDYESGEVGASEAERAAIRAGAGLLAGCVLRPRLWRRDPVARDRFLQRDLANLDVIGAACQRIGRAGSES